MAKQSSIATKESRAGGASYAGALSGDERMELDENYDLISVLYHSLQGAETCERYIRDAEQAEDHELAEFLSDTREEQVRRAARARQMLMERLYDSQEEEEEEEEEEEDDEDEEGGELDDEEDESED